MNVNERYTAEITGLTSDGEGVARVDGQAVFLPGVIPGEKCRFRIVNIGKTCAHAVPEEITEPSPHRVKPDCPHFPRCGGCDFRFMDYETELSAKRQRVLDALTRIGGVEPFELPITGAENRTGYRNKVQFPVQQVHGRPEAGFYQAGTHQVIPVRSCAIQPDCAGRIRRAMLDWMEKYRIAAYDEKTHRGFVRHLYIRCGFRTGQILVCIVANCKELPKKKQLVQALLAAEPDVTTVVFSSNCKRGNSVLGEEFETLYGPGYIEDELCGLRFRLSPRSFYQVNRDQAEILYGKALQLAQLEKADTVLDLYCGTGTITLCLARQAGRAIGVEIIPEAIADAKQNAARNGVENAEFFCADAGEAARRFAESGTKPDVIVVDPPRKGLSGDVVEAIVQMAPRRLVYVSCDPATLARDVKLLCAQGFAFRTAECVDLFPSCAHVETVVLMSRDKE